MAKGSEKKEKRTRQVDADGPELQLGVLGLELAVEIVQELVLQRYDDHVDALSPQPPASATDAFIFLSFFAGRKRTKGGGQYLRGELLGEGTADAGRASGDDGPLGVVLLLQVLVLVDIGLEDEGHCGGEE